MVVRKADRSIGRCTHVSVQKQAAQAMSLPLPTPFPLTRVGREVKTKHRVAEWRGRRSCWVEGHPSVNRAKGGWRLHWVGMHRSNRGQLACDGGQE